MQEIVIETNVDELRTMQHFDQAFYGTPNSYRPYIASRPSFRDDVVLATPLEVIAELGWDMIEESCDTCLEIDGVCEECGYTIRYIATV